MIFKSVLKSLREENIINTIDHLDGKTFPKPYANNYILFSFLRKDSFGSPCYCCLGKTNQPSLNLDFIVI